MCKTWCGALRPEADHRRIATCEQIAPQTEPAAFSVHDRKDLIDFSAEPDPQTNSTLGQAPHSGTTTIPRYQLR